MRVPSARRKTFRRQRSFDISGGGGLKGGDSSNTDSSEGDSSCDSWRRPATSMVNLRQPGATATEDKSQQLDKEHRKCLLSTTSSSVTIVADRLQTDNGKCPRKTTDRPQYLFSLTTTTVVYNKDNKARTGGNWPSIAGFSLPSSLL